MTKNPLTMLQLKEFLNRFKAQFFDDYVKALDSGAVEDLQGYTLARCILQISAKKFEPLGDDGREMLQNLEKFV